MTVESPRIIRDPIPLTEVRELAEQGFGDMVKASVDVARVVVAIGLATQSSIRRVVDGLVRR